LNERALTSQVQYNDEGLAALIFTAEGDMRQAINNLQSTYSGFGFVSQDHVFKICDQPHPIVVRQMIKECQKGDIDGSLARIGALWDKGYSAVDIVTTVFRVVKGMEELPEYTKLEYIRVSPFLS
jgi:replication factor C subunit 2/4